MVYYRYLLVSFIIFGASASRALQRVKLDIKVEGSDTKTYNAPQCKRNLTIFQGVKIHLIFTSDYIMESVTLWFSSSKKTDHAGISAHAFDLPHDLKQLVDKPTRISDISSQAPSMLNLLLTTYLQAYRVVIRAPLGSLDHCLIYQGATGQASVSSEVALLSVPVSIAFKACKKAYFKADAQNVACVGLKLLTQDALGVGSYHRNNYRLLAFAQGRAEQLLLALAATSGMSRWNTSFHATEEKKVLNNHLTRYLEDHSLINDRQHGFGPKQSTGELLVYLTHIWGEAIDNRDKSLAVSLDIAIGVHWGLAQELSLQGSGIKSPGPVLLLGQLPAST
ncbi:hypothetical protein evm_004644 [Chilo suppressalis]|nr:hypothetical protein evm_004644 [Chilo suppressalis]